MIDVTYRSEVIGLVVHLVELAERVGLSAFEVEKVIAVQRGVWPIPAARRELWWPTEVQATRVCALFEVCATALAIMGDEAAGWLRRRNVGLGQSPIAFLLSRPEGVIEMRDIIAREAGRC